MFGGIHLDCSKCEALHSPVALIITVLFSNILTFLSPMLAIPSYNGR